MLGDELHPHPAAGQLVDQPAQVVEVAGEPVHRVHERRVTVADELEQRPQLRPVRVPS